MEEGIYICNKEAFIIRSINGLTEIYNLDNNYSKSVKVDIKNIKIEFLKNNHIKIKEIFEDKPVIKAGKLADILEFI